MSKMNVHDLPCGFRFKPTEEELICGYLWRKVTGLPLPCDVVKEKDIYGDQATPWKIFSNDEDAWDTTITTDKMGEIKSKKRIIYVFARLKKFGKKRIVRTAGCGTWNGQTAAKEIKNSKGELIGSKKMLVFELQRGLSLNMNGHWIMYEYSLDGVSLNGLADKAIDANDYVLCQINRDDSKSLKKSHGFI